MFRNSLLCCMNISFLHSFCETVNIKKTHYQKEPRAQCSVATATPRSCAIHINSKDTWKKGGLLLVECVKRKFPSSIIFIVSKINSVTIQAPHVR
uniref:Secreted protein n=1 Tax=Anguilla anguilla TaxID=7936 RepID=A0A0E9PMN0_ANGAN